MNDKQLSVKHLRDSTTEALNGKESAARRFQTLSVILFSLYLFLLVWLIALKCNMKITITDTYYIFGKMTWGEKLRFAEHSCLSLFKESTWKSVLRAPRQDVLNVVAFLPFGIYLGYFIRIFKLPITVLVSFSLSLVFETVQLLTNIGCFSAVDLITNTIGGLIGYMIYKLIYKDTEKRIKLLTAVTYVVMAAVVILVCYALVKTASMLGFYWDILSRRY